MYLTNLWTTCPIALIALLGAAACSADADAGDAESGSDAIAQRASIVGSYSLDNQAQIIGLVLFADETFTRDRGPSISADRTFTREAGKYAVKVESDRKGTLTLHIGGDKPRDEVWSYDFSPGGPGIGSSIRPTQLVLAKPSGGSLSVGERPAIFEQVGSWCTEVADCQAARKAKLWSPAVAPQCASAPNACITCSARSNRCALEAKATP